MKDGKPVKYKISFLTSTRGKIYKAKVCNKHKKLIENNCNRVNKLMGYDYSDFKSTAL